MAVMKLLLRHHSPAQFADLGLSILTVSELQFRSSGEDLLPLGRNTVVERPEINPAELPLSFCLLTEGGIASVSTCGFSSRAINCTWVPWKTLGRFLAQRLFCLFSITRVMEETINSNKIRNSGKGSIEERTRVACAVAPTHSNWCAVYVVI